MTEAVRNMSDDRLAEMSDGLSGWKRTTSSELVRMVPGEEDTVANDADALTPGCVMVRPCGDEHVSRLGVVTGVEMTAEWSAAA